MADELADVAITALVAIDSLGFDHAAVLATCAEKVLRRVEDAGSTAAVEPTHP